jgi:hypothetical protein
MNQRNNDDDQGGADSRRVNPRRKTRSLVADVVTAGGVTLHGVSHDVSPFGASFHITSGSVDALAVGDMVTVNTSTAEGLRAEINSIHPVSAEDSRPLVGMKLLGGASWLGGEDGEAELVEPAEALSAE